MRLHSDSPLHSRLTTKGAAAPRCMRRASPGSRPMNLAARVGDEALDGFTSLLHHGTPSSSHGTFVGLFIHFCQNGVSALFQLPFVC
mmetsp:Transcript_14783/g.38179  ORF Transcript_14783/g.38179 Transcript_14783/m.38179 type:complete len:87 (+) Transcript_14783:153-413(+)